METPHPQPPSTPTQKGNGTLIALTILLIAVVTALLLAKRQLPAPADPIPPGNDSTFGSLEAELEATDIEGMSDSL